MLGVSTSQIPTNNNTSSVRGGVDGGAMVAVASAEAQESGGTSGGSCGDVGGATTPAGIIFMSEETEKSGGGGGGGNRWPRQETLALLKIRSDMDLTFRDSSLKGPLWDEVSRKMAELGYHRNPKKCKEKFENVYKYHKRTKEGRSSKSDGKTYRFFDQLQALENIGGTPPPPLQLPPQPRPSPQQTLAAAVTMAVPIQVVQPTPTPAYQAPSPHQHQSTVPSTAQNTTISFNNPFASSFPQPSQQSPHPPPPQPPTTLAGNNVVMPPNFFSNSMSLSSSSTSSDEETEARHKRKRKYKDFFETLMQNVVEKQEALQKKFLETLEKRERDRLMREEAWRAQEMARLRNEHDLLVQERSMAAERESALITLLQKMTENQQIPKKPNNHQTAIAFGSAVQVHEKQVPRTSTPPPSVVAKQSTPPPPLPPPLLPPHVPEQSITTTPVMAPQFIRAIEQENNNSGGLEAYNTSSATSSRWPKAEIDALINLRTHLDNKYQENGPKGPLWEEISAEMKKIGYNRNAKRCKEKWENINKYYKKVKESNKKRPEDSKTCPYFHQLDALYKEKEKKPENSMMPIMAMPEQQWPFPQQNQLQQQQQHQEQHAMEEQEGENNNEEEYDDEDDDGEDDEEDEGSAYEIVTNKQPSSVTSTT